MDCEKNIIRFKRGDSFKFFGTVSSVPEDFDLQLWTVESTIKGAGVDDDLQVTITGATTFVLLLVGGSQHFPISTTNVYNPQYLRMDIKYTSPDSVISRTTTLYIDVVEEITQ